MIAKSTSETIRSPGWIAALVAIIGGLGFLYFPLMSYCFGEWLKPDYSHGFLVPLFSIYLAWMWKSWAPAEIAWPDPKGVAFIALGAGIFVLVGIT
ncbi:MAG TPA: archaeosortase/exosortase family protein, partial [Urbifossiella sp.]